MGKQSVPGPGTAPREIDLGFGFFLSRAEAVGLPDGLAPVVKAPP
jgi:hypothetical protein